MHPSKLSCPLSPTPSSTATSCTRRPENRHDIDTHTDTAIDITDEELEAEALAADPDAVAPDDAVPFQDLTEPGGVALLPSWYAAAPMGRRTVLAGWRRRVALLIVISFIAINAYGLCSTYGYVEFA